MKENQGKVPQEIRALYFDLRKLESALVRNKILSLYFHLFVR